MEFYPEGMNAELDRQFTTPEALRRAMMQGSILESRVLLCDREHNLHVDLGAMRGIIPREEGAVGIDDGTVRDVALISKVGKREAIRRLAPLDSCTFDSFDTNYYPETAEDNGISPRAKADKIAEACHRYAQRVSLREPANLMLMGQTGLGKTHLSLAIANVAIGRGLSVEYGTAYNILSDLQNENFGRTGNLQYTEERVLHTDLLILDDLGTEYTSAYTVACLYNIINTRILCSRPTVISTNLGFDELAQKYDQRITSRIAGAYSRLVLVGNDIRYIK
jgi:DNA replication protein DnaC